MSAYVSTFDSDKKTLSEVLNGIHDGKIQLPDFQRSWVWDDAHICSLLASISLSYPVGAVLFLEADGDQRRFLPRVFTGAPPAPNAPELLVLDGQQRLTSLYQVLQMGGVVETQNQRAQKQKRWYYIDMNKALDKDAEREDAIVSFPEDRILRTNFNRDIVLHCSTTEKECEAAMFPLRVLFDVAQLNEWRQTFQMHLDPPTMMQRVQLWNAFESNILSRFLSYLLPIIRLTKETPTDAVAQVFEKVNTGGVALTVFELVTAMFSSEGFRLREDWDKRKKRLTGKPALEALFTGMESKDFLTAVTLLSRYRRFMEGSAQDAEAFIKCQRKDVLELRLADYEAVADDVIKGFIAAAGFLVQHKIFQRRDIPYSTQLIPLATILAALGDYADRDSARQKVAQWFWCGVFGELYSSGTETRFAKDLPEVVAWIKGQGDAPSTVVDANFAADRLERLQTRNSAAYKGVSALLMNHGGLDFRTGTPIETNTFFDSALDIHHIFPQAWCKKQRIQPGRFNSIINKTPLSSKTNRIIGGSAPRSYLKRLEQEADMNAQRLNDILRTHLIPPELLRQDAFEAFYAQRKAALLDLIEQAMCKPVMRDAREELGANYDDAALAEA